MSAGKEDVVDLRISQQAIERWLTATTRRLIALCIVDLPEAPVGSIAVRACVDRIEDVPQGGGVEIAHEDNGNPAVELRETCHSVDLISLVGLMRGDVGAAHPYMPTDVYGYAEKRSDVRARMGQPPGLCPSDVAP